MLEKLERKFGKFAIKGLMKYVVIVYAVGFITYLINPEFYYQWLMLDIDKVLQGQVWRLVSFIIQPIESDSVILTLLMLYVYFSLGTALERVWGSFRFNMFYFSGVLFNILAVIVIYVITYAVTGYGVSYPITLYYLNMSMFLAFAAIFPDIQFLLMFLIPVKAKYMFAIYGVFLGIDIYEGFTDSMMVIVKDGSLGVITNDAAYAPGFPPQLIYSKWLAGVITILVIVVSLLNFIIYFVGTRKNKFSPHDIKRRMEFRRSYNEGNVNRNSAASNEKIVHPFGNTKITRHKCCVCGKTEKDDPDLEFRFCTKCEGNYEYCSEHIYTHVHKTGADEEKDT